MLVDCLLQRPLKEFHAYLKGFHERLYEPAFSSLLQSIIYRLIDNKAPRNPNSDDRYDLDVMMNCFYPYAANTSSPDANARLSICIEQMHSLLSIFGGDCLKIVLPINFPDEEVMKVINEGTAARREKCAADDKKKMPAKAKSKQMKADVDARMNLIRSGESIARSMNGWFEIQKILRRRANGEICGYYGGADAHLNEIARQNDAR